MDREASYPGPVLRTAASYAWRLAIVGAVLYFGVRLLWQMKEVVIPFTVALLLVALLRPVLVFLRHRGLPRGVAALLTLLFALAVVGGILFFVITRAIEQAPELGKQINLLIPKVKNWLLTGPLHVDKQSVDHFSNTLSTQVTKNSSELTSAVVTTGKTVIEVLTGAVLGIFVTVFLLYDGERVWQFLVRGFPAAARARVDDAGRAAWLTLSHYVRGTLIVAAFHGIAIAIVLLILGVPLVAPLALLVALGSIVPIVGAVVTGLVAVGVAGVTNGLGAAIVVAIMLVIDNQVEAHVLQPFVVGRYVHLHPLAIVLGLTVGALVASIYGAIIAVPLLGCINVAVKALRADDTGGLEGGPSPPEVAPTPPVAEAD